MQQQLEQQKKAKELVTQLIERMAEIRPIFAEVIKILNAPQATIETQFITEQSSLFINNKIDADKYIELCQIFLNSPQKNTATTDYVALTKRINRGEMVLFIGSDLLQEYGEESSEEIKLANVLAKKVGYSSFTGTLSSIAELYQLLPEHGRISLLSQLHKALPCSETRIKLYDSLAKIKQPLVLISSAYDNLLEQAFIKSDKKYVELSSIIMRSDEYDIGHVVVRYSDNTQPERIYSFSFK